ncbi:MAG: type II toxin-antitoxin system HipA family toxin [Stellaceae bacterium]
MDKQLLVYVDLDGDLHLAGRLWAHHRRGRESASFEYDGSWLRFPARFALEPALTLGKGPHHTAADRTLFGAIGDSAPDRWGRALIQREERRKARAEERLPRTLGEIDYLVGIGDVTRQGALRFAELKDGPFLAAGDRTQIPPLVRLRELLDAALRITADEERDDDIKLLLAPGSSLGGARPKASVIDQKGQLLIAKFPHHDDQIRISLWEALALTLAAKAGISTPKWRIENIGGKAVLLLHRFDREDGRRIPFLSAMSMLGAADNESHSYLEIADAIRQYGARTEEDCAQLWRRVVFNVLISNTDDHLRNHAFLYESGGWRLAPAYDLNPVPQDIKARVLTLAIDEADGTASLDLALSVAAHFRLKGDAPRRIVAEVGAAVASWRREAKALGLTAKEIDRMASAFEHDAPKKTPERTAR